LLLIITIIIIIIVFKDHFVLIWYSSRQTLLSVILTITLGFH